MSAASVTPGGTYDQIHWLGINWPYRMCPSLLNQTSPTTFPASCSACILVVIPSVSPQSSLMSGYNAFHGSSSLAILDELAYTQTDPSFFAAASTAAQSSVAGW